jgi:hypothetical protein
MADENGMSMITRVYLFFVTFVVCLVAYLLLLCNRSTGILTWTGDFFKDFTSNLILALIGLALISWLVTELVCLFYALLRRKKIGRVLISQGYITEDDVNEALSEQRRRIGEILTQEGRLTAEQLNEALSHQRKVSKRLGEVLKDLGYVTDEDVSWALDRVHRKLGEILREKGYVTDYEVHQALMRRLLRLRLAMTLQGID